ncbi:neutral cholesterol ester hydrolase 1 [Aplysia californica]|uniref:Neutral cholesterol ester hydrolase 1 n=1 Tax=Aplysia californica TaxID=6500 RepID=A0ABM1AAB8_APLCA|nr:neutral cholesterol ester hydrolase 1 [Aplysia californica]
MTFMVFLAGVAFLNVTIYFMHWFYKSKIPEKIPEQFKVRVIDANLRFFKNVVWFLQLTGLSYPFSPLVRWLGERWLLLQQTGWPWWRYTGSSLKVRSAVLSGVPVRIYEPVESLHNTRRPVLIYIHGGAFAWLSAELYESFTSRISELTGAVVISVNYRLCPEVSYPAPRDDCVAVVKHVLTQGQGMRLDTSRMAVGGDSAGGNLSASLALEFKDKLKLQLLLVPALQPLDTLTSSAIENQRYMCESIHDRNTFQAYLMYGGLSLEHLPSLLANSHVSTTVKKQMFEYKVNHNALMVPEIIRTPDLKKRNQDCSFGEEKVWDELKDIFLDPYFSPLLADDSWLSKTPTCYVMTAGYDVIRDDGVMYFTRLLNAGVKATLKNYDEGFHNSLMFHKGPLKLEQGERILFDIVDFLKENL